MKAMIEKEGNRGFTLIELMIVLAVMSILLVIAVPNYQKHIQKTRRADAQGAVHTAAAQQEQYFFRENQYTGDINELAGADSPEGYYELTVASTNEGHGFVVTAKAVGVQTSDTDCQTFTLTHLNQEGAAGKSGADNSAVCW